MQNQNITVYINTVKKQLEKRYSDKLDDIIITIDGNKMVLWKSQYDYMVLDIFPSFIQLVYFNHEYDFILKNYKTLNSVYKFIEKYFFN